MGTILSRTGEPLGDVQEDLPGAKSPAESDRVDEEAEARKRQHEEDMSRFKAEIAAKREARKEAIAGLNRKIGQLRAEVAKEREERQRLESALEEEGGGKAEVEGLQRQVRALKDVAAIGGEMLRIRDLQVNELKNKLLAIEETGVQYEKEVDNMRKLKGLYEERSRAMMISHQMEVEREKARVVAAETRLEISEEKNRELAESNKQLQERAAALDGTVDMNNNEISELRVQLAGKREELYNVTQQLTIINNLFSQVLLDPENLDRVTRVLEEHHNLVNHLTEKGNINDVASVLMTVADKDHVLTEEEQDIATNLSKVWKLLVELLGHHNKQTPGEPMPESCYKSIDTPTGPKLVISVSQTFLRLKDLILEKNSLVKEVGRLKDLNCHLEKRLVSQESRLAEVAEELHKTWGVVNKLKSQHKSLHTHEQVLRYELKHKRLMLNELKQQLEECREMWQMARSKNNQTEKDWRLLRKEFADRKQQISSAESGYEESPGDSQDEDDSHRLSDDESEVQEYSGTVKNARLRISRLGHAHLNTPDRCSTPDVSETDLPPPEEPLEEQVIDVPAVMTDESQSFVEGNNNVITINDSCPQVSISTPEIINDRLNSFVSSDEAVSQTEGCRDSALAHLESDEMTVEIEPRIQILPWNEPTSEEPISEIDHTSFDDAKQNGVTEGHKSKHQDQKTPDPVAEHNDAKEESKDAVECSVPSCSADTPTEAANNPSKTTSAEDILARREARLKRLEEQCQSLFSKMSHTNKRSDIISSKLVELHEHYGEGRSEPATSQGSPAPPTPERSTSPQDEGSSEYTPKPDSTHTSSATERKPLQDSNSDPQL